MLPVQLFLVSGRFFSRSAAFRVQIAGEPEKLKTLCRFECFAHLLPLASVSEPNDAGVLPSKDLHVDDDNIDVTDSPSLSAVSFTIVRLLIGFTLVMGLSGKGEQPFLMVDAPGFRVRFSCQFSNDN